MSSGYGTHTLSPTLSGTLDNVLFTHLPFAQVERPHCVEEGEDVINLVRGDGAALHDAAQVAVAYLTRAVAELPGPHGVLAEEQDAGGVFD